jgi:hypothetical protein
MNQKCYSEKINDILEVIKKGKLKINGQSLNTDDIK